MDIYEIMQKINSNFRKKASYASKEQKNTRPLALNTAKFHKIFFRRN